MYFINHLYLIYTIEYIKTHLSISLIIFTLYYNKISLHPTYSIIKKSEKMHIIYRST